MDDLTRHPTLPPTPPLTYGPPRAAAAPILLLALVLALLAAVSDPAGRLLLAVGALLALAAAGWVLGGPTLTADDDGLRVRGVVRTHAVPWAEVQAVLVDPRRRSRALEIETGADGQDALLSVPALLLGRVSPDRAAEQLRARRG